MPQEPITNSFTLSTLTPFTRPPSKTLSTWLRPDRLIQPGQPASKNQPITGHFYFLILWAAALQDNLTQNARDRTRLQEAFYKQTNETRPRHRICARPFNVPSHEVTFPKQGLDKPDRMSALEEPNQPNSQTKMKLIRPQGDPDYTHWAHHQTRHVFRITLLKGLINFNRLIS